MFKILALAATLSTPQNFHSDGNSCHPISPCDHEQTVAAAMLRDYGEHRIRRSEILPDGNRLDLYRSPRNSWTFFVTGPTGFSCEFVNGMGGDILTVYEKYIEQLKRND